MRGTDLLSKVIRSFGLILGVLLISTAVSATPTCAELFHGPVWYPLTSALNDHYRDEHLGREIEVSNGEITRKIFFYTRYLTEKEARKFEVFAVDGILVDHRGHPLDSRYPYMFVMDQHGRIFASTEKRPGIFHHSSFLAGRPVAAAGEFHIQGGILHSISAKSGHYQPSWAQLRQFIHELERRGAPIPARAKETFDPAA